MSSCASKSVSVVFLQLKASSPIKNINIKIYNYNIEEISEDENSKDYGQFKYKQNMKSFSKLPRINFHYGKVKANYAGSNEFSSSLKHNMSNQSIGDISVINTHYSKSLRKKPNLLRKDYISPYSKKNIENIIKIM